MSAVVSRLAIGRKAAAVQRNKGKMHWNVCIGIPLYCNDIPFNDANSISFVRTDGISIM